jgi:Abnormal spindle-like microcephaly-assoc'd, ASPM-SPD-2-Hydin
MRMRTCMFMMVVFTTVYSMGQSCQGDCQTGAIAGPYTAAQTAENTAGNFPQCVGSSCGTVWNGNQLEGIDAQQNIGNEYQFYDQNYYNIDANIAVGPTVSGENAQVLEWVNGDNVQAFDKVSGQPIFTIAGGTTGVPVTVDRLWSSSTQPECQDSTGNVQVIFDRLDNVFVISRRITYLVSGINHYSWCVALSSGSDLSDSTTIWYAYEFKMDTAIPCLPSSSGCTAGTAYYYYPDWPRIGTWSNGFYITFDLQDPTVGYTEAGFEACQLDRADMVLGQSANPMTCYTYMVPQNEEPSLIHSVDVGDIDSANGENVPPPEYFLSMVSPSNQQQGNNGEGVCTSQSTPCTSNQLALFTWGASGLVGPTFVTVNPYTPGCYDTSRAGSEVNTVCVPVPSTNLSQIGAYGSLLCGDYVPGYPCLDSLGDRLANRLTYNNLPPSGSGPNGAYLTASHVVMESASNERTGIRYYILQVSNGAATVLVNSGGTSGPPDLQDPNGTLYYFMPSAALDKNGNLAIEYTTSGAYCSNCQTNPAIGVDVLPWGASSFQAPTLIVQGTGDEENTTHWGQYAATVIDSTDDLTFYGMGEYFNTSQTGTSNCAVPASNCHTWQTRIFRMALPAISLVPTSLMFGPQTINTTSPPQTVTLTNTGGAPLTLSSIAITGTDASDFAEKTNTCGATLAPNDNCQVSVTFTPATTGNLSAAVSITDNAPGSPQAVSLAGTGTVTLAPAATFSPVNLTFPSQYVKNPSPTQTVKLTNTGTATLAIANVAVSPTDFGIVSTQTTCGSSLAAGSSCMIGVFFDPTAVGTRTGTLSVTDNAAGSPQMVALTGIGQDFAVAPSGAATAMVAPGQTANYMIAVTPDGGFDQTVTLSCSGAPAQSACSLSSNSVALNGSTPASVTVTVTTAGSTASLAHPAGFPPAGGTLAVWLAFCGLPGLALLRSDGRSRKRHGGLLYGLACLCLISLGIMFSSCGGGSGGGTSNTGNNASATPPGSYDLTVTGTFTSASSTLTHATKLTLVVQ